MVYNSRSHSPGFQCYKYAKGLHKESMSISERKLIPIIYEYFEKLLSGMDFEYEYLVQKDDAQNAKLNNLYEELEKMSTRENRIRLAFENEVDTLEEYKANKERLKKSRESIQEQISSIESNSCEDKKPPREEVLSRIKTVYDIIKDPVVDNNTKGTIMRSLVEDIVFDKENGKLIFHLYIS